MSQSLVCSSLVANSAHKQPRPCSLPLPAVGGAQKRPGPGYSGKKLRPRQGVELPREPRQETAPPPPHPRGRLQEASFPYQIVRQIYTPCDSLSSEKSPDVLTKLPSSRAREPGLGKVETRVLPGAGGWRVGRRLPPPPAPHTSEFFGGKTT